MQRRPCPNLSALTVATAGDQPVGGGFFMRSGDFAAPALGLSASDPLFDERTIIDELRDVFPRRALIVLRRRSTAAPAVSLRA